MVCAGRRRQDDDLSLVAGMTAGQRRALKAAGIGTGCGFAGLAGLLNRIPFGHQKIVGQGGRAVSFLAT
jgi:hypothetical protein